MPTTETNVLQALRAAIQAEKANPTPDQDIIRKLRSEVLRIKGDPDEIADQQKADLVTLRIDPASLTLGQLLPALSSIRGYYAQLADDDPDPQVVDQKKIRNKLRNIVDDANAPQDVRDRCEYFLRGVLKEARNADPIETTMAQVLGDISAASWDEATLDGLLDQMRSFLPLVQEAPAP